MWSVRIDNVNEILQKRVPLFHSYYCYIRNFLAQIFTTVILYILIRLGATAKTKYIKLDIESEITHSENEKLISITNQAIPTQDEIQFLQLACRLINNNYCGDRAGLEPFLRSIELLESIVEKSNEYYLRLFILSRLQGRASEVMPTNLATIKEIKDSLKKYIRYDQSTLISAKIQALPYEQLSLLQFVSHGETLSFAYQRALIQDGLTPPLANRETITRLLEMCLTKASSDTVKIILKAASFDNSQDLFSKFLSAEIREKTNNHSKYSLSFNNYTEFKRNQNYKKKFKYSNSLYTNNVNNTPSFNQYINRVKARPYYKALPQNGTFYNPNDEMNKINSIRRQCHLGNENCGVITREPFRNPNHSRQRQNLRIYDDSISNHEPYENNSKNTLSENLTSNPSLKDESCKEFGRKLTVYDVSNSHVRKFDNPYFKPRPVEENAFKNSNFTMKPIYYNRHGTYRQNYVSTPLLKSNPSSRYSNQKAQDYFRKDEESLNKQITDSLKIDSSNAFTVPNRSKEANFHDSFQNDIKMHKINKLDITPDRPDYNIVKIQDLDEN